jgi:hypothetical protein
MARGTIKWQPMRSIKWQVTIDRSMSSAKPFRIDGAFLKHNVAEGAGQTHILAERFRSRSASVMIASIQKTRPGIWRVNISLCV